MGLVFEFTGKGNTYVLQTPNSKRKLYIAFKIAKYMIQWKQTKRKRIFWIVVPCSFAGAYQRFGGIYLVHL